MRCLGNASKCIRDIGREQLPRQPLPPSAPIGMRRANIAEATRWINLPGNTRPWKKKSELNSMYSGGRGFCVCAVEFRDLEIVVFIFRFHSAYLARFHSPPPRARNGESACYIDYYVCDVSLYSKSAAIIYIYLISPGCCFRNDSSISHHMSCCPAPRRREIWLRETLVWIDHI